jgi:fumarate reductase subunit D
MEKDNLVHKIESVVEATKNKRMLVRLLAAISYLGIFCFLPFVLKTKDDFIRFHARQGLLLFGAEIILTLILIIPFLGWLISFLGWLICGLVAIVAIVKACQGKFWKIPILNKFSHKINF